MDGRGERGGREIEVEGWGLVRFGDYLLGGEIRRGQGWTRVELWHTYRTRSETRALLFVVNEYLGESTNASEPRDIVVVVVVVVYQSRSSRFCLTFTIRTW